MKKYNELTELGKKRRMHDVAREAVKRYDIDVKGISYITEETNIFFKITDNSGEKYALKIFEEESSQIEDNLAEVFLIEQVAKNSDIIVPEVLLARDGSGVVMVEHKGFECEKRVAIYKWLEGGEIDGREDDEYFYKLGEITAKLHEATKNITIPKDICPKKWDKVFYYRGEEPIYKQEKYQKYLTSEYHEVMDSIIPYLDEKLAEYYDGAVPQLIHGDLNPYNVWSHKNELRVIDFEEAMYGIPIHDFAIALFYYKYDDKFDYPKVYDSLLEGYSKLRTLPDFTEFDIELLMTARRVNFLNYGLLIIEEPTAYADKNIKRVKEFMKKYL